MTQQADGPIDRMTIEGNCLNGGNYTIYVAGTNVRVVRNGFVRDFRYGIRTGSGLDSAV